MIDIPYKMIFAVGTIDSIFIYDTMSITPRYAITNIHYQAITDLAWNGSNLLAASSADGYISFYQFDKGELGTPEDLVNIPDEVKIGYEGYINADINKNIYQHNVGKDFLLMLFLPFLLFLLFIIFFSFSFNYYYYFSSCGIEIQKKERGGK